MHAHRSAAESELVTEPEKALKRLRRQLVLNSAISDEQSAALDDLLLTALKKAGETEEQTLTVMNPVSRPQQLRLAVIAEDRQLDTMYGKILPGGVGLHRREAGAHQHEVGMTFYKTRQQCAATPVNHRRSGSAD